MIEPELKLTAELTLAVTESIVKVAVSPVSGSVSLVRSDAAVRVSAEPFITYNGP